MKNTFLAASGVFAAIPGVAILVFGLGTPPGYSKLFGAVIEAFGALVILLLLSGKAKIRRLPARRISKVAVILMAICFSLLVLYLQLAAFCVVTHPIHGIVYYPLWTSGHLKQMVARAGSRYAAIDHYGSYPLMKAIQEAPDYPFSMVVTTAILLLVYQGIFSTVAAAFGIIGMNIEANVLLPVNPEAAQVHNRLEMSQASNISESLDGIDGRCFDVFLSHNASDKPAVRELARLLLQHGVRCWLDEQQLRPGQHWQREIAAAIRDSRAVIVLIGGKGMGQWEQEESAIGLNYAARENKLVIPVLLPHAPNTSELPAQFAFLENRMCVDFREGFAAEKLQRLVDAVMER